MKLDWDFGDSGKTPGRLYWAILGAVKQADQFWSQVAPKAFSEELNELRKSDEDKCTDHWGGNNST